MLFIGSVLLALIYVYIIYSFLDGWLETSEIPGNHFSTKVTVVIAAFNEEENIEKCVKSVLANKADLDELLDIIVIDNGSTDRTLEILKTFENQDVSILEQPVGFKKDALQLAFNSIDDGIILCTDADCIVEKHWASEMIKPFIDPDIKLVLGPVKIKKYRNLVERFQAFDMLAMMGITAGGLKNELTYLANGANMAFAKSTLSELPDSLNHKFISGDDVFLLHAIEKRYPGSVIYNKNKHVTVQTEAVKNWNQLINQRKRWASKTSSYIRNKDKFIAAYIFLFCVSITINVVLIPFTGGLSFFAALFQLFIKGTIDYAFIARINEFFDQRRLLKHFIPSFFVHFGIILFSGISGIFKLKFEWKGKR